MATNPINHDHFSFSYRADCIDCDKYVGPKRDLKADAEADAAKHRSIGLNGDHTVKIEVTQTYHI